MDRPGNIEHLERGRIKRMTLSAKWHLIYPSHQFLSGFERFAAFQAISLASCRDESTKWTHPLWRELVGVRFHPQEILERRRHQCKQTADTGKEWVKCRHNS
jgi:hypothetical protein